MTHRPLASLVALSVLFLGAARTDANLIVVENGATKLDSFTTGALTGTLQNSTTTNLDNPIGLAISSANQVYVVDQGTVTGNIGSPFVDSVARYQPSPALTPNGFFIQGNPANPGVLLNAPNDITFDSLGNAYITQGSTALGNSAVLKFTSAGSLVGNFGTSTTNTPFGITFSAVNNSLSSGQGLLFVANETGNNVTVYDPNNLAAGAKATLSTGANSVPLGVAVDASGNVYVSLFGNGGTTSAIEKFTFSGGSYSGAILPVSGVSLAGPIGLAFDTTSGSATAGDLFVAEANAGRIDVLTPTGAFVSTFASGLNSPSFLAFQAVPEPGSVVMMGLGQVGLIGYLTIRRKRRAGRAA